MFLHFIRKEKATLIGSLAVLVRNHPWWLVKARSWKGLPSVTITWPVLPPVPGPLLPILCFWYFSSLILVTLLLPCLILALHFLSLKLITPHNHHPCDRCCWCLSPKPMKTTLDWPSPIFHRHSKGHISPTILFSTNSVLLIQNHPSHKMRHHLWSLWSQKPRKDVYPFGHPFLSPTPS